jgi:hypothetical protein
LGAPDLFLAVQPAFLACPDSSLTWAQVQPKTNKIAETKIKAFARFFIAISFSFFCPLLTFFSF